MRNFSVKLWYSNNQGGTHDYRAFVATCTGLVVTYCVTVLWNVATFPDVGLRCLLPDGPAPILAPRIPDLGPVVKFFGGRMRLDGPKRLSPRLHDSGRWQDLPQAVSVLSKVAGTHQAESRFAGGSAISDRPSAGDRCFGADTETSFAACVRD
jgi:hypothetical protein